MSLRESWAFFPNMISAAEGGGGDVGREAAPNATISLFSGGFAICPPQILYIFRVWLCLGQKKTSFRWCSVHVFNLPVEFLLNTWERQEREIRMKDLLFKKFFHVKKLPCCGFITRFLVLQKNLKITRSYFLLILQSIRVSTVFCLFLLWK